jgi:hypothetical protein
MTPSGNEPAAFRLVAQCPHTISIDQENHEGLKLNGKHACQFLICADAVNPLDKVARRSKVHVRTLLMRYA